MSARKNPFEDVERFVERMSRQFEDAASEWNADAGLDRWMGMGMGAGPMAVDLVEADGEFVVTVDLPGYDRGDVEVSVTDDVLRIDAERERETDEEEAAYVRRERRHDSAHRTLRLPADVDAEGVEARMTNGVLTVTLPKVEPDEPHHVDIE